MVNSGWISGQFWHFSTIVFHLMKAEHLNGSTQNMATAPAISVGNLWKMQLLESWCRPTKSETLGLDSNLYINKLSRWSWYTANIWELLPLKSLKIKKSEKLFSKAKRRKAWKYGSNITPPQGQDSGKQEQMWKGNRDLHCLYWQTKSRFFKFCITLTTMEPGAIIGSLRETVVWRAKKKITSLKCLSNCQVK